jgi:hypothetical protein
MADWGTGPGSRPAATGQAEGGGQAGGGWRQAACRRGRVRVRTWRGAVYRTLDRTGARQQQHDRTAGQRQSRRRRGLAVAIAPAWRRHSSAFTPSGRQRSRSRGLTVALAPAAEHEPRQARASGAVEHERLPGCRGAVEHSRGAED